VLKRATKVRISVTIRATDAADNVRTIVLTRTLR
jgi:hypothetical protein